MTVLRAATIVTACLLPLSAAAQSLELSRAQRNLLKAVLSAVDDAGDQPPIADHDWRHHVLRASDGSHYVAFTISPPPDSLAARLLLYVRLAPAAVTGVTRSPQRSAVRDWLNGSSIDPRLRPQPRGFAVGDMPPMGAGAIGSRGAASVGSADLQIMELQRERARQRKAAEDRKRRALLEGGDAESDVLPFEDFDVTAPGTLANGSRVIQRALTSGPGMYDLFVAWADASQRDGKAPTHVVRRTIALGTAGTTDLAVSSVIVADRIGLRAVPNAPHEQRAHPYAIGLTDITPAGDTAFTPEEHLSAAFQIINPTATPSGLPSVQVSLRIVRLNGLREEHVAALSPLTYDATTLPADFDVRQGHPLIAAMSVPLATIPRGAYRLLINAEDRVAATVAATAVDFTVVGSLNSLLSEAPALAARFHLPAVLSAPVMNELLDRLTPSAPSAALAAMIDSARSGRLADLLVASPLPAAEQGLRTVLNGLALLSLANPSAGLEFERALSLDTPEAPVQFLLAASRALAGRDQEAITALNAAKRAGFPASLVDAVIAESHLRLRNFQHAADALPARPAGGARSQSITFAATRIGVGREAEAVNVLDDVLESDANDIEARWLLLHALYAEVAKGNPGRRARFRDEARRYLDAKGRHAGLAAEWLAALER